MARSGLVSPPFISSTSIVPAFPHPVSAPRSVARSGGRGCWLSSVSMDSPLSSSSNYVLFPSPPSLIVSSSRRPSYHLPSSCPRVSAPRVHAASSGECWLGSWANFHWHGIGRRCSIPLLLLRLALLPVVPSLPSPFTPHRRHCHSIRDPPMIS